MGLGELGSQSHFIIPMSAFIVGQYFKLLRKIYTNKLYLWDLPVVQWLRLLPSNAGDMGLLSGGGTESHMPWGVVKIFLKNHICIFDKLRMYVILTYVKKTKCCSCFFSFRFY